MGLMMTASTTPPFLMSQSVPFAGAVVLPWQLIGPSGHDAPAAGTLQAYTSCIPREAMQSMSEFVANPVGFCKSFTATWAYDTSPHQGGGGGGGCDPHLCNLRPGAQHIDQWGAPLSAAAVRDLSWDRAVIYHYVTRYSQYTSFIRSRLTPGAGITSI